MESGDDAECVALMERALRLTEAFTNWPAAGMSRLLAASRVGRFARGDYLFSEGDRREAIAVVSGYITIRRASANGGRTPVGLAGPGILIGVARAIVEDDDEIYDYSALDDSVVVLMPTPLLLQILEQFPLLWRDMALKLLKQNRAEMSTLMKRMIGTLSCRLAGTIERLATLYGVREQGNLQVRLRLTQEDLASILQVTRQSVNKDLRMLELRGVVALDYNIITVLDPEALKKAASESR